MKKTFAAVLAAATIAGAAVSVSSPAEARWRGNGGAVAAGVIGGIAAGALIAGAAGANPYYGPRYYAPPPPPAPVYYGGPPAYYGGPQCYWQRQRVWDGYGWQIRPVRVCY